MLDFQYGIGLLIMIFLEMKILILGMIKTKPARNFVGEQMYHAIKTYHNTTSSKNNMDFVQLSVSEIQFQTKIRFSNEFRINFCPKNST